MIFAPPQFYTNTSPRHWKARTALEILPGTESISTMPNQTRMIFDLNQSRGKLEGDRQPIDNVLSDQANMQMM
jgi:hypothetical protein